MSDDTTPAFKACTKCGEELPATREFFSPVKGGRFGLKSWCKKCSRAWENAQSPETRRRWHITECAKDPETLRARNLKAKYGITIEDYDRMFAEQGGECAICGHPYPYRLHVDHDHSTGQVRGLLCIGCNMGIGLLEHDPERLLRAADYLAE